MDNTYALATSRATAEQTGVRTLSDYAALVQRDPAAAATCVETEFNVRQDGFPGMAAAYGFDPPARRSADPADRHHLSGHRRRQPVQVR